MHEHGLPFREKSQGQFSVVAEPPGNCELPKSVAQLCDYWRDLRGDALAPSWQDFEWRKVPTELIRWCVVVDVHSNPMDFIYRFWGSGCSELKGIDYTGRSVRDFRPQVMARKAFDEYSAVVDQKSALVFKTKGVSFNDDNTTDYQFLRLPFSYDGASIDNILSIGTYIPEELSRAYRYYESHWMDYIWPDETPNMSR